MSSPSIIFFSQFPLYFVRQCLPEESQESERICTRSGVGDSDRIRSGDVSNALTEVLREEMCLPRAVSGNAKPSSCSDAAPTDAASTKLTSPSELQANWF
ncbi:hypothetical protein DY000_02047273 [Brassica cretica]|uniref:Uncharacterized protein n=1 Tax=Brassica cretica TaxID=69181 RepID=A0ABQ7F951_BRACR|nr:hypothetical protein DY000_02047273 [Brassica cretica]